MAKKYFLDLGQFEIHTPQLKKGDVVETAVFELNSQGENCEVEFEARSVESLVLSAVLVTGEQIYLDGGNVVSFNGRVRGCVALTLDAKATYSVMCSHAAVIRGERLDPTPVSVSMKLAPTKDLAELVREEVANRLRAIDPEKFGDPDLIEELIEEALGYDHEFEDDDPEYISEYEEEEDFDDVDAVENDVAKKPAPDRPEDHQRPPEAEQVEPSGDPS